MRLRPTSTRHRAETDGFSLIELMVVLLIIAILLGVAIPTYLSARNRAENRAAQESLRTGLVTLESVYTEYQTFEAIPSTGVSGTPSVLQSAEPALQWTSEYSYGPNNVAAGNLGNNAAIEVTKSKSGRCFWLMEVETVSAQIIRSSFFNSETVTGPGVWYASRSPGGSNGQCVLGLTSPWSWSLSSMQGWR